MSKLGLDPKMIARGRSAAAEIAHQMDGFIRERTTVAVERTVLRLMGVDGVDIDEIPLPNRVIEAAVDAGLIEEGITRTIARAMLHTDRSPQQIAEAVAEGTLNLAELPHFDEESIREVGEELAVEAADRIKRNVDARNALLARSEDRPAPLHYVIVATGNIYEDAVQAKTAARQGADIVAVIRSTGQSLLDYVPYGPTTEGFGGTYATQGNFKVMRDALDEVGEELGRYIRLCNYCSGLCMPEIAAMGALERLDVMLNDALYGILFRDINPQRTFVDQYFSRMINAYAGVIINTGEDNYLTTADAVEAAHTVLASQFINEQFALKSGLPSEQMGLGHAFEMNPDLENGFLLELAQAEMASEIFPDAPLKYMPPTKYMTGNIFKGHIQDALFNLIGVWTKQGIQLLGMMTEAMHTPHMGDRHLALENAQYVMNNARDLGDEIQYKPGGVIQTRAQTVLADATELLEEVREKGMFNVLAAGTFADVFRPTDQGKGLDGVFKRSADYYNPLEDELRRRLAL
ncbi:lysine 5,6-aminomutase subunit alpha [Bradymonas sediminis]|uniref:D-lysine 5,6-aminomutase subunit alpha n=1 Tax=Bradymonas sediminis TaxID=1548548 RepID=A0A2Z4FP78_9DELT|nr:lysine 5,6-aminomutase subunit alpha [Bradymonas sediminis]AWV90546.1 D-lysine 5,6-aminomutase subunit alpha [Bradymonas sediminis]TDP72059.1 beta-lysine 5,6-aminomutase alpha subunit /D-lysine 5,6-aminomutase alpha subunit [Bradymonas sediminis]